MKLQYLHANSHLFPRIPLQAFPCYANGACRDLCSPSPWPAYGTWTDANQSTASYYPDDPFVEQPCSTSPWTAYGPRTDATQNTASYYQDDPLVEQQCPCADSSAEAYQTHAYYDAYSPAAVPGSCISCHHPENAAVYDVPGKFSNTTGQAVANVSETNVNFAHSPYCLPSGEAHGPQHPEPEPRLPSPTCSAALGIPIVTRLADQFATLHSFAPPPGSYMLQGITICPPLIVERSPRPPESPALRRRRSRAPPRSSRASSTDGPTCISPFSTTNPFQALADLAAPDLDDRQEFPAETSQTFNSAPPGYTLVRKPLRTEADAPMQLPKKGNAAPRPRKSRRVGTRKHPPGHHKIKGTPFCRSLAAAEPRIVQPQAVSPPTYPWRPFLADDLPEQPPSDQSVSACDLPSLQISSDSSPALRDTSTPDIPRGKFWDYDSTSEPDAPLHVLSGPYSTALSASTVTQDLYWLHPDPLNAEIESTPRGVCSYPRCGCNAAWRRPIGLPRVDIQCPHWHARQASRVS